MLRVRQVANYAREVTKLGKDGSNIPANKVANLEAKRKKAKNKTVSDRAASGAVDVGLQRSARAAARAPGAASDADDSDGAVVELLSGKSDEDVLELLGDSADDEDRAATARRRARARKPNSNPSRSQKAGAVEPEELDAADVHAPRGSGRAPRKRRVPSRFLSDVEEAGVLSSSGDEFEGTRAGAESRAPKSATKKILVDKARQDARNRYLSEHARNVEAFVPFKLTPPEVARTISRFAALCDASPPESFERDKIPRLHTKTFKSASWKRYVRYDGDVYCLREIYPRSTLKCIWQINGVLRLALHGDHNREVPGGLALAAVRAVSAYERILPPSQNLLQNHVIIHMVPIACHARERVMYLLGVCYVHIMCIICAFHVLFMRFMCVVFVRRNKQRWLARWTPCQSLRPNASSRSSAFCSWTRATLRPISGPTIAC